MKHAGCELLDFADHIMLYLIDWSMTGVDCLVVLHFNSLVWQLLQQFACKIECADFTVDAEFYVSISQLFVCICYF